MASETLKNFSFTFSMRNAPSNGPSSSDAWNDSFTELATDLANISLQWNNKIVPIVGGLPYGDEDTSIDAFVNGLDAKNMWVDQDASSADDDTTYFDATNNRPVTVHEALVDLYEYINTQIDTTTDTLLEQAAALTTDQKNAIGINIFDDTQASSSSSLDGKSENNRLNIIQLAQDLYGAGYALGNDGNQDLTFTVMEMVDALLELHGGDWHNNITLTHTGISALQTSINSSMPGDDAYAGSPSDLQDDLNVIRTEIRELRGTGAWTDANTALYGGGPDDLEGLLTNAFGTGTPGADNPWGYHYNDVEGLSAYLSAISTFIGQDSLVDETPDYSSTTVVANGDSLETAIGKLDASTGGALLTDGTRPMTGGLNMGSQDIAHVQDLSVIDDITVSGDITASGTVQADVNVKASGMMRSETTVEAGTDMEVTSSGGGYITTSPNGTRWRIQVDDGGTVTTTAL